jgi:ribosomal protein L18
MVVEHNEEERGHRRRHQQQSTKLSKPLPFAAKITLGISLIVRQKSRELVCQVIDTADSIDNDEKTCVAGKTLSALCQSRFKLNPLGF